MADAGWYPDPGGSGQFRYWDGRAVRIADGFAAPEQAAKAITQCVASSSFYASLTSATSMQSTAVTIDGHSGWSVRTKIFCHVSGHPDIAGDEVVVIVVDVGDGESLGMYLGTATIDDSYTLDAMRGAISSLRVER